LLPFPLLLACAGILLALCALLWARRISVRLERLSQSYWELRYEQGQLGAKLDRLDQPLDSAVSPAERDGAARTAFVPLSSLRK
jgi:hypothetical protein